MRRTRLYRVVVVRAGVFTRWRYDNVRGRIHDKTAPATSVGVLK